MISFRKKPLLYIFLTFFLFCSTNSFAITGDIKVCFTPGGDCANQIINEINK
jgi:hypothetical protein